MIANIDPVEEEKERKMLEAHDECTTKDHRE